MKKVPWGILAGICAIFVFYLTVGVVAAYIVLGGIAAQTNTTAGLFDCWWQILLFVGDIIFMFGFSGSCIMFFMNAKRSKRK